MRLQVPERTWLNRPPPSKKKEKKERKKKEASSGSTTFSVKITLECGGLVGGYSFLAGLGSAPGQH